MASSSKKSIHGVDEVISSLPKEDLIDMFDVMKRADKNLKASPNISIETGWFGTWITALSPHEVDKNNIDAHMICWLERDWDQWKIDLTTLFPNRKHILEEAFKLHEEGRYLASIPLFFSQADGICGEFLGKDYFSQQGFERIVELYSQTPYGDQNFILDVFKAETNPSVKTIIRRKSSLVINSDKFPNRHGILHGDKGHLEYGTKINSLKALSFLQQISFVISEIQEHSNKEDI